jgi:hypothetical protein
MKFGRGKQIVLAVALCTVATQAKAMGRSSSDDGYWVVQTSLYTRHFAPDPQHNNRQELIGLERNRASGLVVGAATFRNSFAQRSFYGYAGKRWDSTAYPVYFKLTGGLLQGYRGEYRDKIPLNRLGVAPVIIPGIGANIGPITTEALLLGASATMLNVGLRF